MKKKSKETKHHKQQLSAGIVKMRAGVVSGNYYAARRDAHAVLMASDKSIADKEEANRVLKITWPDPVALLAGLACLSLTLVVSYFSAY
jgi:hypothetical protein